MNYVEMSEKLNKHSLYTCKIVENSPHYHRGLEVRSKKRKSGYIFLYNTGLILNALVFLHDDDAYYSDLIYIGSYNHFIDTFKAWAIPAKWSKPKGVDQNAERKRLEKIAKGLSERKLEFLINKDSTYNSIITEKGKLSLEHDLACLNSERILIHFPYDPQGRLALKTSIVLNVYETSKPPANGRVLCLTAAGPDRRKDNQNITILLQSLILENQTHRWTNDIHLWQDVETPCLKDENSNKSVELIFEGRIKEALKLYKIGLSDNVNRLLGGQLINAPACPLNLDEKWRNKLIHTLNSCAPWKLALAAKNESDRLEQWASEKKSRRWQPPMLKLVIFPDQDRSRKACLMLTSDSEGKNPRLIIEVTASNKRIHDTAWKRSIYDDLHHFNLCS